MRNFNPKTVQDSERLITRYQEGFGDGMFDDIPASKIPENGVKYSKNYYLHRDRAEPRGGCRQWGKWSTGVAHAVLPSLPGRTGYSLTKSGTTVTKTVGTDFTSADVGNYIFYDDGSRERIDAYISATQVTMDRSDAHAASTAAYIGGPVNRIKQHKKSKMVVLHIDTRLFISDDIFITNWVECHNVTPEYALDDSISIYDEKDDYVFLYNPAGIFRLDLSNLTDLTNDPPYFFKVNTPVPTVNVTDVEATDTLIYGRRYLYTMTRLSGNDANRDRHTSGVTIEQISGPVAVDDDFKDYGEVYTSRPVGLEDTSFQTLTGAALASPMDAITWWAADTTLQKLTGGDVGTSYDEYTEWTGITDGEFTMEFDGTTYNVTGRDFSACTSMGALDSQVSGSVAEVLENGIRAATSGQETVRWDAVNTRFIVRSAEDADSSTTLSYATIYIAGGGTDISSMTALDSASATISTETSKDVSDMQFRTTIDGTSANVSFDAEDVATFALLADAIQTALQDIFGSHVTCVYSTDHFVVSSEKEGGTVNYAVAGDAGFNVAAHLELDSASATITSSPWTVQSQVGTFTMPLNVATSNKVPHWTHYSVFASLDVGVNGINPQTGSGNNPELFVWVADIPVCKALVCGRSGNVVTASEGEFSLKDVGSTITWQSGTTAEIAGFTSTTQVTTTDSGTVTSQAASIGGGRVMTASQTGTTISRTGGANFSVNDVGRTHFWSNGRRSVITEYTNANSVEAYPSQTVSSQGGVIDPVSRVFNDTVEDATLRTRAGGYSLPNRYFKPLPNCDLGVIIGVFMWVAIRGEEKVYYSQIPSGEIYRVGYYNEDRQVTGLKDKIVMLREFTDRLVAYCSTSTRGIATNVFDTEEIPEVGEVVAVATGQFVIDRNVGLQDFGSIKRTPHGKDLLITNELAVRDFDGQQYSMADLAYNRIGKKLIKLENATASAYHRDLGYVVWGLEE